MSELVKDTKKGIKSVCAFFESAWFTIAFGAVVFLFYALNLPLVTVGVFAVCGFFICIYCEDTRPGLTLVLLIMFSFRYKDNLEAYTSPAALVLYIVAAPCLLIAIGYRLGKSRVTLQGKFGFLGVSLFCVAILMGGVFTEYYTTQNFIYALAISLGLFGCYAFFAFTLKSREDNLLYLARVLAVGICVIFLELFEFYLREYEWGTPLDSAWKGHIALGWSISNMVAEMIVFALPAAFYLIYKEKYGYLYWGVVGIGLIAVYFTFARGAMLGAVICTIVGVVVNCLIGKNRKINCILMLCAMGAGLCFAVLLYYKGYLDGLMRFFLDIGLSDRGRFAVWGKHLAFFSRHPVFGVGFEAYRNSYYAMEGVSRAHNNLVQMISSTGIVGLALYLIHRAQTVYMIAKKPTADRLFMGGCIGILLLMSMLSSTFFHIYAIIHYSVILLVLEKSGERSENEEPEETERIDEDEESTDC